MRRLRLQSAMEYLMTYGWAILIIAVVLGALFQLGVFNSATFAPRAAPGSCQVFRPNGPGSPSFVNLQGVCTGQLPQYIAAFNDSRGSEMSVANLNYYGGTTYTLSVWVKVPFSSPTAAGPTSSDTEVEEAGSHCSSTRVSAP
ncbi:MAG: hypothetical protein M1286_03310 [Candidatus Marsarchaeota archaeon]|nr:hypothetical protein [Candidatus Marsarchaeota archaeon]